MYMYPCISDHRSFLFFNELSEEESDKERKWRHGSRDGLGRDAALSWHLGELRSGGEQPVKLHAQGGPPVPRPPKQLC